MMKTNVLSNKCVSVLILLFLFVSNSSADIVCRRAYIDGFKDTHDVADVYVGPNTTTPSKMMVYVTAKDGYLYAQSNFVTPSFNYPTKLAVRKSGLDAESIVLNLLGEGVVSGAEVSRLTRDDVVFIVDREALIKNGQTVDFDGVKKLLSPAEIRLEQARAAAERSAMAARAEQERVAAAKAAEAARTAKRVDYDSHLHSLSAQEQGFSDFRRAQQGLLSKNSTSKMRLFSVIQYAGGTELQTADGSIFLTSDELARLKNGVALDGSHALSNLIGGLKDESLVLYTGTPAPSNAEAAFADEIAFAIQRSYSSRSIIRDPYSAQTPELVAGLNGLTISGPQDLITLIAGDSFNVIDWKIIQNIQPDLERFGNKNVFTVNKGAVTHWNGANKKLVIVITGHIDENLKTYIKELGDAGYFKGNYVLLNTCNDVPTRDLVTSIMSKHGALAAFCYDKKIDAENVENFMHDLTQVTAHGRADHFVNHLRESMQRNGLSGIWTVCWNFIQSSGVYRA